MKAIYLERKFCEQVENTAEDSDPNPLLGLLGPWGMDNEVYEAMLKYKGYKPNGYWGYRTKLELFAEYLQDKLRMEFDVIEIGFLGEDIKEG
jgi:hypothetical protein